MIMKKIIDVGITGAAPLLMNRFIDESNIKKAKKVYDDEEEAKKRLYLTADRNLYQPSEHIEGSMIKAGIEFKYSARKTYKEYIKSGVVVMPYEIIHKIQDWVIDKRPVVIQKNRIMRCRPRLDKWELEFQIEVINPNIDLKILNEILINAGLYIGIGDYRPKFGRFIVSKFKEN